MSIQIRKKEHVDLSVAGDVQYRKTTGFEYYDFVHNALPELNVEDIDLSATLLGRKFSFPLFISSMTGGYSDAGAVNAIIATFCEEHNLPFGVGSQRAMLEDPDQTESFSIVREYAPNAFIAANIGGAQLINGLKKRETRLLINSIRADAIIVHLNPLQELMQPEGDRSFKGVLRGIELIRETSDMPIIVKETGAGISGSVAEKLLRVGVKVIDVSGAGGTSWSRVENLRERQKEPLNIFDDWGIPTAECITEVSKLKHFQPYELIASGGIRTSFDMIKALALGADFTAAAQPVIKAIAEGGGSQLNNLFERWTLECRIALALLGCSSFSDLDRKHLRTVH